MSPEPVATWITTEGTAGGMGVRAVALALIVLVVIVVGVGSRDILLAHKRNFLRVLMRAVGREALAEWDVTTWLCGSCRSISSRAAIRCLRCHAERAAGELDTEIRTLLADTIPDSIEASGKRVALEHNSSAHRDNLASHWVIRVNGNAIGSASLRDGALALLRLVEGTDRAFYDPDGAGLRAYLLSDLIAAFEQPRLPLNQPCPESPAR